MDQALARLERVTDRLERLEATRGAAAGTGTHPTTASAQQHGVKAVPPAPAPQTAPAAAPAGSSSTGAVGTWGQLLRVYLDPLAQVSSTMTDPQVVSAFQCFQQAFEAVGPVLQATGTTKRPDPAGLQALLGPVAQPMMELGKKTEGRRTDAYNHVKALSESVQALSFLAYDGPASGMSPPPQHVADSWQSAEFFTTRVQKEFKDKGEAHGAWVRALKELMLQLAAFVEAHFPTGPKWGVPQAAAATAATATPATATRAPGGGPPPPPPPGPPPPALSIAKIQQAASPAGGMGAVAGSGSGAGGGGMTQLFQELSSQNLTAGLKKVTDDMKTKNRADRASTVTMPDAAVASLAVGKWKAAGAAGAAGGRGGAAGVPSGTPALELRDRKWYVEYQVGNKNLVVEAADPRQSVSVYACKDCVVKIKGKVNNISLDSCVKTGVMFEDVIASCEVVNCKSIQLQADGAVPTISVEKTDGCQLYLNKRLTTDPDFQIVTAKCSAMNAVVMQGPDEDPLDLPIPEQFISTFSKGQLVTVAASHSGA